MIRKAEAADQDAVASLMLQLWPHHIQEEMEREAGALLKQKDTAVFLKWQQNDPVGFAQCQLRHDYVEGCDSSPVGYLEGLYVKENHRGKGIAKELLITCEKWAKEKGCREFASDCELNNTQSLHFHMRAGFAEANRIICFVKKV